MSNMSDRCSEHSLKSLCMHRYDYQCSFPFALLFQAALICVSGDSLAERNVVVLEGKGQQ